MEDRSCLWCPRCNKTILRNVYEAHIRECNYPKSSHCRKSFIRKKYVCSQWRCEICYKVAKSKETHHCSKQRYSPCGTSFINNIPQTCFRWKCYVCGHFADLRGKHECPRKRCHICQRTMFLARFETHICDRMTCRYCKKTQSPFNLISHTEKCINHCVFDAGEHFFMRISEAIPAIEDYAYVGVLYWMKTQWGTSVYPLVNTIISTKACGESVNELSRALR